MKVLVGLTNDNLVGENEHHNYKMSIIEVDEIKPKIEWIDLDVEALQECSNVKVNLEHFKSIFQNPTEYLKAEFDVNKLIGLERCENDFQITNIYYDEYNRPQLYRVVNSSGVVSMHDISELGYQRRASLYGHTLEKLSSAYHWWKAKDDAGKKVALKWFSGQFEVNEDMPVKLLYHYLVGVKNFQVGYHIATEITSDDTPEIQHEYMLFKDTANVKLIERISKNIDIYGVDSFLASDILGTNQDDYPKKRRLGYDGATMSMICSKENFESFYMHNQPTSYGSYDESSYEITIDDNNRSGFMHLYNKMEEGGFIQKNWRLDENNDLFGMTEKCLIPRQLSLLSTKLQKETESAIEKQTMPEAFDDQSTFYIDNWMKTICFALSTQYYSFELKQQMLPIFDHYQNYYCKRLDELIEQIGAKETYAIGTTQENSKNILSRILNIQSDGSMQKSNIDMVDQMENLFTIKRNDYDLPDWLQIYSPSTIEHLGGVDLLK